VVFCQAATQYASVVGPHALAHASVAPVESIVMDWRLPSGVLGGKDTWIFNGRSAESRCGHLNLSVGTHGGQSNPDEHVHVSSIVGVFSGLWHRL
jgi:hypothetical protein